MKSDRLALAFDIGATWIRIGFIRSSGEIIEKIKIETRGDNFEEFEKNILEGVGLLSKDLFKDLVGIGIGSIGPMDLKKAILNPPNIKAKNIDLRRIMRKIAKEKPVYLANDCVAAVIGEYLYGKGRGFENLVYITLSTGIGGGVIIDGEPLIGKDGNAHEIGHLVIDRSLGVKCGCGGIGHWEGMCSGSGIPRFTEILYRSDEKTYKDTILKEKIFSRELTAKDVYEAYYKNDILAKKVVEECNEIHAAGTASVINAYDPEIVIFGGSIILNNRWILSEINNRINKYLINRKPILEMTDFGDEIVLIGAGALVLGEYPKKNRFRIL